MSSNTYQRDSEPRAELYQSQWWIRLASFSSETATTPKLQPDEAEHSTFTQLKLSTTKRGLRESPRWPLYVRLINKINSYLQLEWLLQNSSGPFQKRTNS